MKLKTLIIDDEPIALEKMKSYVGKTQFLELAGAYPGGVDALEALAGNDIDVIFTDINMPDMNGLDMVSSLTRPPLIVFITAYSEYAVESYRHSAVDYLLEPYSLADFQRAANKVLERHMAIHADTAVRDTTTPPDSIFIKVDYRYVRVSLEDIRYIKGYGEYLQIFVEGNNTPLLTLSSFASVRERLSPSFLQIHRSYIVNMNHVTHIERARVVMDADTWLPVGDSYKTALQDYLAARGIGGANKK